MEETDAVVELEREQYFEYRYRTISEKIVRLLDTGQLMGDPLSLPIIGVICAARSGQSLRLTQPYAPREKCPPYLLPDSSRE